MKPIPKNSLAPLVDLASSRSLDLFFRVGQGYVARADPRHGGAARSLSPHGVQSRAAERILCLMTPAPRKSGPLLRIAG
ncbi:hypothetical protein [Aquamicrobium sp. LC103]|uniref:hypothetical protein n=1 Tax=Aquamicrobium sp. LC103 TaxID=1120658 RepID=UPI00063E90D9|nr:hypothetical protein [Aquamicrobium sp. LC103]